MKQTTTYSCEMLGDLTLTVELESASFLNFSTSPQVCGRRSLHLVLGGGEVSLGLISLLSSLSSASRNVSFLFGLSWRAPERAFSGHFAVRHSPHSSAVEDAVPAIGPERNA